MNRIVLNAALAAVQPSKGGDQLTGVSQAVGNPARGHVLG
jgi:hypothetical protein